MEIKKQLIWAEIRIYEDIIGLARQHGLEGSSFLAALKMLKAMTEEDLIKATA